MIAVEDLSFSNIVNIVQGEEIKGADLICGCAMELEAVRDDLKKMEKAVSDFKYRERELLKASKTIAQHIKKQLPLTVQRNKYIVVVSDNDLTIERNVI